MVKFNGTLTVNNCEEVAGLIFETLQGKKYTFVSVNEYFDYRPEIRINQELKNGTNRNPFSVMLKNDFACFDVCDSYGVWGLSTSQKENYFDASYNAPYIEIENNTIKITLRAPYGNKIYWLIQVE